MIQVWKKKLCGIDLQLTINKWRDVHVQPILDSFGDFNLRCHLTR